MASTIRVADTQLWVGKALSPSSGRWLKRALGAAQKRDRSTRVDPEIYAPQQRLEEGARLSSYTAPTPIAGLFMDLPLIRGDESEHEPYFAATSTPWAGGVALYAAAQDSDYVLQDVLRNRSVIGTLQAPLPRGRTGLWDRQTLTVKLVSGALKAVDPEAVLAGANVLAIGDGSADNWEIVQFAQAQLTGNLTYQLTELLRGQRGSSAMMPDAWPAGSRVVIMDGRPAQITIPTAARGRMRHFRYGPVKRSVTDGSYRHVVETIKGNGLRPYPVVHLRAARSAGDLRFAWIRQTRIDGDLWGRGDVPLGEEKQTYVVQVRQGDAVRREESVGAPGWVYTAAMQAADGVSSGYVVTVAQLSARYGTGPFTGLAVA